LTFTRTLLSLTLASAAAMTALACATSTLTPPDATPIDVAPPDGGGPYLTSLSVSAGDASLTPPFSPGTYDYSVQCAAKTNTLTVSATAPPGTSTALLQPKGASLSQPVEVAENGAVVVTATEGKMSTEYWVRCLPPDFPTMQWTPHPEAGVPTPGYYLVGTFQGATTAGYALILDRNGVPVWYTQTVNTTACDVDSLKPNEVSFDSPVIGAGQLPEPFEVLDFNSSKNAETSRAEGPQGYDTDEHELRPLPNGDYLVISAVAKTGVDLTGLVLPMPSGNKTLGDAETIANCMIVEFTPAGKVVHTWSAYDHFDPRLDNTSVETTPVTGDKAAIDVYRCNSIDVDPATNGKNLLVSARNMSSVFYVEWPGGTVLWKLGGSNASKDGATFVSTAKADAFHEQHDARFQPGWSPDCNGGTGQISVFDDESSTTAPPRGVVYDVVVGGGDAGTTACDGGAAHGGTAGTAKLAWQYKGIGSSLAMGSLRVSPDGSRVISWGINSTEFTFSEVDEKDHDLLDFHFGGFIDTYRAIKVPLTQFDLEVLRKTAGTK
jgi:hypothetical protein